MSRTLNIEKKFMDAFRKICSSRSSYAVWDDLVTMIACSLSNAQEPDKARFDAREAMYQDALKRIGHGDIAVSCFAEILGAFMEDPAQDFLGTVYGLLRINSKDKGQFFTPYHVSDMMAKMMLENAKNEIKKKGIITINDPCCGAGSMLIAAANVLREQEINYQSHAFFVAQDIDPVVAKMCYIQMSLIGCAGYVLIGNSLANPPAGSVLIPDTSQYQDAWFTPMYYLNGYHKIAAKEKAQ